MNSTRMTLILADLRRFKNRVARAFEARSNSATEKNKKGIIIFPILTFCFSPSFLVFWPLSRFYPFLSAIIRPIRVIRVPLASLCLSLLLFCSVFQSYSFAAEVIPGIDILARRNFDLLQGKRVGLITNNTGRSLNSTSSIDLLAKAPGVQLVALFSPEHGIRGDSDVKLSSATDQRTGLPIYSLYGKSCRPTPEMMTNIQVLVFDIQDIGARFYTYIGTLHHALLAARQQGIPLVVLDRPNPLGGVAIEGAVPDAGETARRIAADKTGCRSLTVTHPIPTRHGLTIGELARLINTEAGINANLQVVSIEGWKRELLWQDTRLAWVNPSPNMKDPTAALLYPGFGPLEATNLSVARGTGKPFHRYGAPWLDPAAVLKNLPPLPGLRFSATSFTPTAPGHPYQGKPCNGIEVTITDLKATNLPLAGLYLVRAIQQAHPKQYHVAGGFYGMLGDNQAWKLLREGIAPERIMARWQGGIEQFKKLRKTYLLY
ncbi:conserved hypothetical protein [Trichlorobacter lovleyi SZ]|uniref:DUF1343 domain-containing protein n=1 Tax=Trichlorobacter lovleyi (strain ATCC BAA-1151 / DSM 17278 / SZ) TaxID=398767 RepID=B3EAQ7_TRIL1|nr:conserved hypothetical protein [Trichlorobacter lovleyi SZ]